MRLDRLITLRLFYPLNQFVRRHRRLGIPILMYHSISDDEEKSVHPYYRVNTVPSVFKSHMAFLAENHFQVIGLSHAIRILCDQLDDSPLSSGSRYAVVTFDDGFLDFYKEAYPILKNYHFTADVFLPVSFITDHRQNFKNKGCLTWSEIRELRKEGISFGSHTMTHPQLRFLQPDDIRYELKNSKEIIEDRIGGKIDLFSYPYAFPEDKKFKAYIGKSLEECGYKGGVSTMIGLADKKDERFFLKRLPINSDDDIPLFRAKLAGAYDWLAVPQRIYKTCINNSRGE
jgi:peptidoglycan/xylan/chitin deacetylase (PgdA/CDA1 family)